MVSDQNQLLIATEKDLLVSETMSQRDKVHLNHIKKFRNTDTKYNFPISLLKMRDEQGQNAFHYIIEFQISCVQNFIKTANKLIAKNQIDKDCLLDIVCYNNSNDNPFHIALKQEKIDFCQIFLQQLNSFPEKRLNWFVFQDFSDFTKLVAFKLPCVVEFLKCYSFKPISLGEDQQRLWKFKKPRKKISIPSLHVS